MSSRTLRSLSPAEFHCAFCIQIILVGLITTTNKTCSMVGSMPRLKSVTSQTCVIGQLSRVALPLSCRESSRKKNSRLSIYRSWFSKAYQGLKIALKIEIKNESTKPKEYSFRNSNKQFPFNILSDPK